jgi:hypothetical protein
MKWTRHALDRWQERFPELDAETEWARARRVGRKGKRKLRDRCPAHAHLMRSGFQGFFYRISRNNVVFVVAAPETIVTVFPYR